MNKDKSIKDLKQYNNKIKTQLEYSKARVWSLEKQNERLEQEFQRKDNIINELEKFIQEELNNNVDKEKSFGGYQCKVILDKLKELKENNGN